MSKSHPSWDELIASIESRDAGTVAEHVSGCAACASLVAEAEALMTSIGTRLPDVPSSIVARGLEAVRRELAAARAPSPSPAAILKDWLAAAGAAVRTVLAQPITMELAPARVLRGVAQATPQMLMFDAPGHTVTVALTADPARHTLGVRGQIVPKGSGELASGGRVGLRVDDVVREAAIGELGDFSFGDVPDGTLEIEVGLGASLIRLTPITRQSGENT